MDAKSEVLRRFSRPTTSAPAMPQLFVNSITSADGRAGRLTESVASVPRVTQVFAFNWPMTLII
jgi:hypothetical protein